MFKVDYANMEIYELPFAYIKILANNAIFRK